MKNLLILGYAAGAIGAIAMLAIFWKDLVENPTTTVGTLVIVIIIAWINGWNLPDSNG